MVRRDKYGDANSLFDNFVDGLYADDAGDFRLSVIRYEQDNSPILPGSNAMGEIILITSLLVINPMNVISGSHHGEKISDVVAPIGTIRGSYMTSRLGARFFATRGIRYAKSPTGKLRFQPPVPVEPWSLFDATQDGPACPQPGNVQQSEDCLRLNVYTKQIPKTNESNSEPKRPIMVFFHPGGFYGSTGQSAVYGPQYLMDKDIVLVTVNYRIATLGFLSTGDSLAPGNLGLKDQVIALRWVQKNIGAFGGDAGNVTISGYSAGSWSVSMHLVSPMSKGLFHRAIAMSGTAVTQAPLPRDQLDLAKRHATLLGCPTNNNQEMIACMKKIPVEKFVNTTNSLFEWNFNPVLLWSPVVEPAIEGVEPFLCDQPETLIRQGKFYHVPVILGQTKDEFGANMIYWNELANSGDNILFSDLNDRWEELAPLVFLYERGTSRSRNISRALREYYFHDHPISKDTTDALGKLHRDAIVGYQTHCLVKLLSSISTKPVYLYEFTYQGRFSHRINTTTGEPYGVGHHDDLLYLFYISVTFPYFNVTDSEFLMVERMRTMWTNFVKTGNPIPVHDEYIKDVQWEPRTLTNEKYLRIDNTLTMHRGLNARDMSFWDSLFDPNMRAMPSKTSKTT